ncbi:MAG: hypothetical protein ACJ71G_03940 [Nitrososphaeraceae archaeon]
MQYTIAGVLSKNSTVLYVEDLIPREAKHVQNPFTFHPVVLIQRRFTIKFRNADIHFGITKKNQKLMHLS